MKEIFVPYRERRHPVWPNGAKLAMGVNMAIEAWDWDSMDGKSHGPNLTARLLGGLNKPDLAITTTIEYGYRVGLPRLIDILDSVDVVPTLVSSALAIELLPDVFRELAAKGARVVGHGYKQDRFIGDMSPAEQEVDIRKCIEVCERILGQRPNGWGSPGTRQTEETLELLAKLGFTYHMGLHDDELPYFIEFDSGLRMVEVPYRIVDTGEPNDYYMYGRENNRTRPEALDYLKSFFDSRYEAAQEKPAFFALSFHPYVTGRPDRAFVLRDFIKYVRTFPDVWITNFDEVASWWAQNPPA